MHRLLIALLALLLVNTGFSANNIKLPDQLTCHYVLRKYTTSDDAALTVDLASNSITYYRYQRDRSFFQHSNTSIRKIAAANYLVDLELKNLVNSLQNNSIPFNIFHLQNGRAEQIEILHIQSNPEMYFLSSNHPYSVRHARVAMCRPGNM